MKRAFCVFLMLLGCGDEAVDSNPANSEANNASSQNSNANSSMGLDGEDLYNTYCAACHGPEGTGAAVWEGSIQGYQPIHSIVTDGRGTMAPVTAVSDPEVQAIQNYLLSFGAEDLSSLNGEEVYQLKCASCHGDQGQGTALGYPLKFINPELAHWVIRNGRDALEFDGGMPIYPEAQISKAQVDQMIYFLHSGPRPASGQELYVAFCGNCHGTDALGGYSSKKVASRSEAMEIIRTGKGTDISLRARFMPAWSEDHLIDEEVRLIEEYMGSLPDN